MLLSAPDEIVELTDLPIEAYQIQGEMVIGLPEEPIIIASRSKERLLETLAVFRGQGASLKNGQGSLSKMLPPGDAYFLYGASAVPSPEMEEGNSPQARILKMTQAASVRIGEAGDRTVANAMLIADSDETASRLTKIINGMTALLSLAQSTEADLVAFIESVKVEQNDSTVTLQMAYSSSDLIELAQANMEKEARQDAKNQEKREARFSMPGELLAQWTADQDLGGPRATANNFVTHEAVAVSLQPGSVLTVGSRIQGDEGARVDYIDIAPVNNADAVSYTHLTLPTKRIV